MGVLGIISSEHFMWCIAIGIGVACVYGYYIRGVLGRLVRRLLEAEAFNQESAVSPADVDCTGLLYKFALRKKSHFREHVQIADGKCYVKAEDAEKLAAKYGNTEGSVLSLLVTLCVFLIVACIVAAFMPQIEAFVKGIFS